MAARLEVKSIALEELVSALGATRDVDAILDRSLGIVLDAASASVGGIYLDVDGRWQLVAHRGLEAKPENSQDSGFVGELRSACGRGPATIPLPGKGGDSGSLGEALGAMGYRSLLGVPLVTRGEAFGCLFVALGVKRALAKGARDTLRAMGCTLGLAVENARRYAEMAQQLRESQTLYEVSRAFAASPSLSDLLNLIVRSAVETIDKADNCVLHLLDKETGQLHPRALSFVGQVRPDVVGRSRMKAGQGVAGFALETGQVVNVPDVSRDPRFVRVGNVRPFSSMLVAPLILGDQRIGTLSVDSQQIRAFTSNNERLLMTLATQAATAIENARLVDDPQQSLHDLKATQVQLIQSEKLSALGQLIAGVAHELNNPLTAVMGYTQLLQMSPDIDEDVLGDLGKIYRQAKRAAKIVHDLLTFARQDKAIEEFIDVNEVLRRTIELRSYQLHMEGIQVVTELSDEALCTMVNAGQLQQVFLNLINNAQEAMAEHGGGLLKVTSELCGDTICARFSDDGPGLSPEAKQHLFEPFFTTKEVGKGTGLGLSICFGIISQYGGRIWLDEEQTLGATFVVELPMIQGEPTNFPEVEETVADIGGKRILLVEDEDEIAMMLERVLLLDGHRVVVARNGEEAIECLAKDREEGERFDLIISDIKMPGLSGPDLYERLREDKMELDKCLIFMTGDTMSRSTQRFLKKVKLPYLAKPFAINTFRRLLAEVLG